MLNSVETWAGLVQHGQTGGIIPSQRLLIAKMIAPVPETYRGRLSNWDRARGPSLCDWPQDVRKRPSWRVRATQLWRATKACNLAEAGLDGRVKLLTRSAENLLSELSQKQKPDFVISGVPLGNLGREKAFALIDTIRQNLGPAGLYIQFQHSLLDRKKIKTKFSNLLTVPVFLNFPPAVVYYARRLKPELRGIEEIAGH